MAKNKDFVPFLFFSYFILLCLWQLPFVRSALQIIGLSEGLLNIFFVFISFDIIGSVVLQNKNSKNLILRYKEFLRSNFKEFIFILVLSFCSAFEIFYYIKFSFEHAQLLSLMCFLLILFIFPLVLDYYNDHITINTKEILVPKKLSNILNVLLLLPLPIIFYHLGLAALNSFPNPTLMILVGVFLIELVLLFLFEKNIYNLKTKIYSSPIAVRAMLRCRNIAARILNYIYLHLEICAIILVLIIIFWPMAISRIKEYRVWLSNFPKITRATPVVGMQGTIVILYGRNFGTTGEGKPGRVVVGSTEIISSEWYDDKIVAVIPVPPPSGDLFIEKKFKWKAKPYLVTSNKIKFSAFDWQKAGTKEVEFFLKLLQKEYK
jgi:hypothetical protein